MIIQKKKDHSLSDIEEQQDSGRRESDEAVSGDPSQYLNHSMGADLDMKRQPPVKNCFAFFHTINATLEFRDEEYREQFYLFRVASTSPIFAAIIAMYVTVTFIAFWTFFFRNYHTLPLIFLAIVSFLFTVALFWVVVYARSTVPVKSQQSIYKKWFVRAETTVTYGFTITTSCVALFRALQSCPSLSFEDIFSCSAGKAVRDIPIDITFIILSFPFIFYIIFPFLTIGHVFINMAIAIAFTLSYTIYLRGYVAADWVVLNIIFTVCVVIIYRLQAMELFLYTTKYYKIMKKQASEEGALAEKLSNEMRQLIASVAHDLKSPLSAFIQGFESLRDSMNDFGKLSASLAPIESGKQRQPFLEGISFMRTTINSLVGTYHILLMTINRCTDYTKISHHIPLSPVLEKINLKETILAPMSALKDLLGKVCVELETDCDIYHHLCNFIITDRQWLQDNLLCLISNAVKYSFDGKSFVRVSLEDQLVPSSFKEEGVFVSEVKETESVTHMLRFEVEDFGVGIANTIAFSPKDDLNFQPTNDDLVTAVFQEPDFTQKKDIGGSGLGLHCLSKRIEALQGRYGVVSKSGAEHGTMIWFTIPYVPTLGSADVKTRSGGSRSCIDRSFINSLQTRLMEDERCLRRLRSTSSSVGCGYFIPLKDEGSSGKVAEVPQRIIRKTSFLSSPGNPSEPEKKEEEESETSPSESSSKQHLLVVDDSIPILKMLRLVLEKNGYIVTTATNGQEAVEKFVELQSRGFLNRRRTLPLFDAILMDIQMPIMTGIEATKRIREIERSLTPESSSNHYSPSLHHLIIAMSATTDDITISEAYEMGIDEFLPKPFQLQAFQSIVEQYHTNNQPMRLAQPQKFSPPRPGNDNTSK